ncbi:hypothetical protein G7Y79_00025g057650 [Physcia stellaris]|nr:hypothetical protein G7Y79_00025g057650 [Physcia stellaris]
MFDVQLRSLKDSIFDPCCRYIPPSISPLHITAAAFVAGLTACYTASHHNIPSSLFLWLLNRALDCLDGTLARHRKSASDLGGFLDLLGDFIVYSLIPISLAISHPEAWDAVAVLEASFHVNNFVLFYVAAIAEKQAAAKGEKSKELTSVVMKPALVEGMESGLLFTAMLAYPERLRLLAWVMAFLVGLGICQRVAWTFSALS